MVPSRNKLFDGTFGCKVPSNNKLFDRTVPSRKQLFDGTVPSRKPLFDGTVLTMEDDRVQFWCGNMFKLSNVNPKSCYLVDGLEMDYCA